MRFKKKIITLSVIMFMILGINLTVHAASASISASKTTATVGDSVKVTVNMNGAAWNISVSGAKSDSLINTGLENDGENISKSESYTIDTSTAGTYTVSISGDITDEDDSNVPVNDSVTITVKEKEPEPEPDPEPEQDDDDDDDDNNSSNNNNNNKKEEDTYSSASGTMYVTGDNVNIRSISTGNVVDSAKKGDSVTITGKSSDGKWYRIGNDRKISASLVSTTKPKEENPPKLKNLAVSEGKLSPSFSSKETSYSVDIDDEDVEQVNVTVVAEDGADYSITCDGKSIPNGKIPINEGLTTVKITVKKDGETNTYTIKIRKSISENEEGNIADDPLEGKSPLRKLEVKGYELSPKFDKAVFNYTINIPFVEGAEKVTELEITAIAEDEDAEVTIEGNENLKSGENIIKIIITPEDEDEEPTVYEIKVKIQSEKEALAGKTTKPKSVVGQNKLPVALFTGAVLIAATCLVLIIRSGRKDDDFDEQFEEDEYESKKDILDTDVSDDAYTTNQYLNDLRNKDVNDDFDKGPRGRRFRD